MINDKILKHPCFHITDLKYLRGKGKKDAEIIEKWDKQLREGQGPRINNIPFKLNAI